MKKSTATLATVAALAVPAPGTAQTFEHASFALGPTADHYSEYAYGVGLGLAHLPVGAPYHTRRGFTFGIGAGLGFGFSYERYDYGPGGHHYDYFGLHDPGLHYCHNQWYDYGCGCGHLHGWHHGWPWYGGWYRPVIHFGWPPFRFDWYSYGSYRHDPFYAPWGYRGWDPYWGGYPRYRTVYVDYDRGYGHTRVATRSPLFGPRYKEDPRPYARVTDNGPERRGSRAVPRGDGADRLAGITSSRPSARRADGGPRTEPSTRTAQPRVRARPGTGSDTRTVRSTPAGTVQSARPTRSGDGAAKPARTVRPTTGRSGTPVVQSGPASTARVRSVPSRQATPTTRSAPARSTRPVTRAAPTGRGTAPKVRSAPTSRTTAPRVRSAPTSRTTPPKARSAPPTRSAPKARSAPPTRSAPKARSAPPRRSAPKARSAPPTRSAPKARSAPPRRSAPKASPPRRRTG